MKTDTPRTDKAAFSHDTFNGVDPWKGERYIKVIPAQLAAELEREVYVLQDIKRRHEADELRMAHEIDQLRGALLAIHEYYKEHMISGVVYKQVEAALSLSNGALSNERTGTE
jgi:hypothetical protein